MDNKCICNTNCQHEIDTAYIGDIDIDTLATLPDYLLAVRSYPNPQTGEMEDSITRIPVTRIVPNGSFDNVVAIEGNNPAITIAEGQVLAGYVKSTGSSVVVQLADATHPAQFLIVGTLPDGQLLIQPTGVVSIPGTHHYINAVQYYVGANGEPTTDPASNQKLFFPISSTQLLINL